MKYFIKSKNRKINRSKRDEFDRTIYCSINAIRYRNIYPVIYRWVSTMMKERNLKTELGRT